MDDKTVIRRLIENEKYNQASSRNHIVTNFYNLLIPVAVVIIALLSHYVLPLFSIIIISSSLFFLLSLILLIIYYVRYLLSCGREKKLKDRYYEISREM